MAACRSRSRSASGPTQSRLLDRSQDHVAISFNATRALVSAWLSCVHDPARSDGNRCACGQQPFCEHAVDGLRAARNQRAFAGQIEQGLSHIVTTTLPNLCPSRRRSEEHTSELQSLMRTSYAVFCLKTKKNI